MTIRAVFFDLDDTLCATTSSRTERVRRAFDRLRADHPDHSGLSWDPFYRSVLRYDPSTGFRRGMRPVLEDLGLQDTPAGIAAHGLWFFDGCTELISSYPGMSDFIASLRRQFKLGLITNGEGQHQRRKIEHLGLAPHFDAVVVSGEVGVVKPGARIFHKALELLGVEPHEAVHVGDHLEADINGAKAIGMRAIWFNAENRKSYYDSATPDATATSYADVEAILNRWR